MNIKELIGALSLACCVGCGIGSSPPDAVAVALDAGSDRDVGGALVRDAASADLDAAVPDVDAGPADVGGPDSGCFLRNQAFVFEVDPVATPTPVLVELQGLGGDGTLTSKAKSGGVPLLKTFSCLDEGELATSFFGTRRVCTLRQQANSVAAGSFAEYRDWKTDVEGGFDPRNVHPEVNLYFHVQKLYALVTSPEVGVLDRLRNRKGEPVTLNLVANYQQPAAETAPALKPALYAAYSSPEDLEMGMGDYQGLAGLSGAVLVMGQAANVDFAYESGSAYHEFGHAVVEQLARMKADLVDFQGVSNMPRALNEGLANTFAFVGDDSPELNQYLNHFNDDGFSFPADTDAVFPQSQNGHPVGDGDPVLGANWRLYRLMLDQWGGSPKAFLRLVLKTLEALRAKAGRPTFKDYADGLLAVMAGEGLEARVPAAKAVLEAHGLFNERRVVDITGYRNADLHLLFLGSGQDARWNTTIELMEEGEQVSLRTANVQHSVVVPPGATRLQLRARLVEQAQMGTPGDFDCRLLVRKDQPIEFSWDSQGSASVAKDSTLAPVVSPDAPRPPLATWTLEGLAPGSVYYLQFANFGATEGLLAGLDVQLQ